MEVEGRKEGRKEGRERGKTSRSLALRSKVSFSEERMKERKEG